MQYFLLILSILVGMLGLLWLLVARTSIHEIQAAVLLLIAAVFLTGSAIVDAVNRLRKEMIAQRTPPAP